MNCPECKTPLPVTEQDPVLWRPVAYGQCKPCSESHAQGWRDFIDEEEKDNE